MMKMKTKLKKGGLQNPFLELNFRYLLREMPPRKLEIEIEIGGLQNPSISGGSLRNLTGICLGVRFSIGKYRRLWQLGLWEAPPTLPQPHSGFGFRVSGFFGVSACYDTR